MSAWVWKRFLGEVTPMSREPTIYDVARVAGVGIATVSRVLNKSPRVSEETREKVLQAMARLNYQPSVVASALTKKKTYTVALFVSDITNPFWGGVARGVEDLGREHGFSVVMCNTDYDPAREAQYIAVLRKKNVDGFIFASADLRNINIFKLKAAGFPIVLLSREVEGVEVDVVRVDDREGGYLATRHLVELGHRRIAIITGPLSSYPAYQRLRGYTQALEEAGLEWREEYVVEGGFRGEAGRLADQLLALPEAPTAIVAANDLVAAGVYKTLKARGVRVPADVSVVGYDDSDLAELMEPGLTTVAQPLYDMGRKAMEFLLAQVMAPVGNRPAARQFVYQPRLVVRGSTAMPQVPAWTESLD